MYQQKTLFTFVLSVTVVTVVCCCPTCSSASTQTQVPFTCFCGAIQEMERLMTLCVINTALVKVPALFLAFDSLSWQTVSVQNGLNLVGLEEWKRSFTQNPWGHGCCCAALSIIRRGHLSSCCTILQNYFCNSLQCCHIVKENYYYYFANTKGVSLVSMLTGSRCCYERSIHQRKKIANSAQELCFLVQHSI